MATVAYRDRSSGAYPISADEVRARSKMLYGETPPKAVLDQANVDPVEAVTAPFYNPATQSLTETDPAEVNGVWKQTWVVTDLPPVPPAAVITFKTDIWRRCTELEAATLDNALDEAPVKMRRLWDDSTQVESSAPEFAMLRAQMVAAFGETRTAEILAPSET